MNVAIIILTWNGIELTKRCLESLKISSIPAGVQIIFVDNGSKDGTVEFLRGVSEITLIENSTNLGYGKAVNLGINAADPLADIILLNNDVEILDSSWLETLHNHAASHPQDGIIGVKIIQDNGLLQHCGAYLPLDTYWGQQLGSNQADIGQYSGITICESVVFACTYIQRSVIDQIGLLDERFFAYFEDTDYCLRASQAGFRTILHGDVCVKHSENSSTKINGVSHSKIFLKSQKTFKEKWGQHLSTERYPLGAVDFHSILNFPSGYAGSAREYIESLDRLGIKVAYQYVYGPGTIFPIVEPPHSDSLIGNQVSAREFGTAPVQVVYAQGDVFEKNTGKTKVGFTMLEVDGLPPEWVRQANLMDEVWVPSHFNVKTFQDSGVTRPIHVIPLGVNPAYFSPSITGWKPRNTYTFLSVFEWGERKAPELLIKAFSDEFSSAEDVVLICKVNNFDPSINLESEIGKLGLRKNGGRVFIAQNRILKQYELGTLYRSADCFVLPTRGEGWGMPILEAMACGLPTIATDWSSQTDFMNAANSLQLEVEKFIPAVAKCPYYQGFNWAQPSYEDLRKKMRWAFENPEKAQAIGQQAAMDVKQKWTWDHSVKTMIERIKALS